MSTDTQLPEATNTGGCKHLDWDTYTKYAAWLTRGPDPDQAPYDTVKEMLLGKGMTSVSEPHLCYANPDGSVAWVVGAR